MKTNFVWIIPYYGGKTQIQIMDTAHADATAVTNNQQKL